MTDDDTPTPAGEVKRTMAAQRWADDPGPGDEEPSRAGEGRLDPLAIAVMALLGAMAIVCLVAMVAFWNRAGTLSSLPTGDSDLGDRALRRVDDADDLVGTTRVAFLVGIVLTAPPFIAWQFRYVTVAGRLATNLKVPRAWAIAGWFVPCANVILPGVQLFSASQASDPRTEVGSRADAGTGSELVKGWAIALGAATLAILLAGNMDAETAFSRSEAIRNARTADLYECFGFLILTCGAVLGALMVRELTMRQSAKVQRSPGAT